MRLFKQAGKVLKLHKPWKHPLVQSDYSTTQLLKNVLRKSEAVERTDSVTLASIAVPSQRTMVVIL